MKIAVVLAALVFSACSPTGAPVEPAPPEATVDRTTGAKSSWQVTTIAGDLDHPWDMTALGRKRFVFTQRDRATLRLWNDGVVRPVSFPSAKIWVSGETGLMGVVADPYFSKSGTKGHNRIYVCSGWNTTGGHDIRVTSFNLDLGSRSVSHRRVVVKGIPTTSGRHGGCRLLITANGALIIGTGDAADEANPRNLSSLGGKTLRVNRHTGKPWPTNPWAKAKDPDKRLVHTFGHRNVQGLAQRGDGTVWNVEQGTGVDDEVNLLRNGGDYGYQPGAGYDESVPMTDQSLPGRQIPAKWSSGSPTLATSGATFVPRGFGSYSGTLAVAVLKSTRVLFLTFDGEGTLVKARAPQALRSFGRIRTVVVAGDGALLVATDNGSGNDKILRVTRS
ncbi:PQQ-dependent sugar dehydrogenase [soil metagenome]